MYGTKYSRTLNIKHKVHPTPRPHMMLFAIQTYRYIWHLTAELLPEALLNHDAVDITSGLRCMMVVEGKTQVWTSFYMTRLEWIRANMIVAHMTVEGKILERSRSVRLYSLV